MSTRTFEMGEWWYQCEMCGQTFHGAVPPELVKDLPADC